MTPKTSEWTTYGLRIQNFSGGGPPDPPAENHTLDTSFNNPRASPTELGIMCFSDFFAKTHSDPCNNETKFHTVVDIAKIYFSTYSI